MNHLEAIVQSEICCDHILTENIGTTIQYFPKSSANDIVTHGILFLLKVFLHVLPKTACARLKTEALFAATKRDKNKKTLVYASHR